MNATDFFNQVMDAATHRQWALLAALLLVGFVAVARWVAPRLHDKLGAFLNTQRGGAILALVGGAAGAVVNALIAGQKMTPQLLIAGFTVGLTAIGGWNMFWDIFAPKDGKPLTAMLKKTPPAAILLPLTIALTFSGCGYCWQDAHKDEPKCVIAHDVVQCLEGDAADAVAIAATILSAVVDNGTVSQNIWDAVKAMAKQLGFKTGGCFWAKLQEYFSTPGASMARLHFVSTCAMHFSAFKADFHAEGVKFCFQKSGQQVCH